MKVSPCMLKHYLAYSDIKCVCQSTHSIRDSAAHSACNTGRFTVLWHGRRRKHSTVAKPSVEMRSLSVSEKYRDIKSDSIVLYRSLVKYLGMPSGDIYGQYKLPQWKIRNMTLIYGRIAKIFAYFRKLWSRNTMVTSDFRPEPGNTAFSRMRSEKNAPT